MNFNPGMDELHLCYRQTAAQNSAIINGHGGGMFGVFRMNVRSTVPLVIIEISLNKRFGS